MRLLPAGLHSELNAPISISIEDFIIYYFLNKKIISCGVFPNLARNYVALKNEIHSTFRMFNNTVKNFQKP